MVTLSSKIVLAKMDFVERYRQKRKRSTHPFWLELWFGRNYDNFYKSNRSRCDSDSIRFKFKFKIGQNYVLILAEIIKFPKKEVIVTLSSKIVLAKMDFCGTGIAKKGNDRHTRFGWNYGLAVIMIIFVNRIDSGLIRI